MANSASAHRSIPANMSIRFVDDLSEKATFVASIARMVGNYVIENGRSSSSRVARDRCDRDARYAAALASPARRQEMDMHQADLDGVACSPRSDASSSGSLKRIRPGAEHGAVVSSPFGSEFLGRLLCVTSRVYASTGPRNFRSSTVTTRVKFFAEAEIRRHNVTSAYK